MYKTLMITRNVFLFFLAPFIALAYIVALPAVGLFYFTRLSIEALHKEIQTPRETGSRKQEPVRQNID